MPLRDPDIDVRYHAIKALAGPAPIDEPTMRRLLVALLDQTIAFDTRGDCNGIHGSIMHGLALRLSSRSGL